MAFFRPGLAHQGCSAFHQHTQLAHFFFYHVSSFLSWKNSPRASFLLVTGKSDTLPLRFKESCHDTLFVLTNGFLRSSPWDVRPMVYSRVPYFSSAICSFLRNIFPFFFTSQPSLHGSKGGRIPINVQFTQPTLPLIREGIKPSPALRVLPPPPPRLAFCPRPVCYTM